MKKIMLTLCTFALIALPGCCPKCTTSKTKKPATAAKKTDTKKSKKPVTKKSVKKYSHVELKPVDDLLT